MKFSDLESRMRHFEGANDPVALPGIHLVARLDGRGFTRLTKELHNFEAPFDARFRDFMLETCEHLMNCGFRVVYGYTQSDEISLLFDLEETAFGRRLRKFQSILAGEASAKFSLLLGGVGVFDCRIAQLPEKERVIDYFRWRNEDAHRNALNAYCYWEKRKQGISASEASDQLLKLSVSEKNELLFQHGINFNDLPSWQKRGAGLYWKVFERPAVNPKTQEPVTASRRKIHRELELPIKDAYNEFLQSLSGL